MGVENVVVARTDAEAATLITSSIDRRDHPFILGTTNKSLKPLVTVMDEAQAAGKRGDALQTVEDQWVADADLKTMAQAAADALTAAGKTAEVEKLLAKVGSMSLDEVKDFLAAAGVEFYFDWVRCVGGNLLRN